MQQLHAPRGTADLYPPRSRTWAQAEALMRDLAARFGYGEIRTPTFEATELFARGIGEQTDIVEKEMYTFDDKGGRSMTLRPEVTAPVIRAVLEHKLLSTGGLRLFYIGPIFRYERPQAGRLRQAHQFGAECLGFSSPCADAEIIVMVASLLREFGIPSTLRLNSIGDETCRPRYREALVAFLAAHSDALSEDSRRRLERNPLRVLDSKAPEDQALVAAAPLVTDYLCAECAQHFVTVQTLLAAAGFEFILDPHIARGLDYYTRSVFEFHSQALGAQSALCGGGRYDQLVASLGGPPTPAVGFALGIERLLMALEATRAEQADVRSGIAVIAAGEAAQPKAFALAVALRALREPQSGGPVVMDYGSTRLDAQLKRADRAGLRFALILGDDELAAGTFVLRDLEQRTQVVRALPREPQDVAPAVWSACREAVAGREAGAA